MRFYPGLAVFLVLAATLSLALAADPPPADEATIQKLVADLGSKDAAVRDTAQKRLVEIGSAAWPTLQKAARSDDPEVRKRACEALQATSEVTVKDLGSCGEFHEIHPQLTVSPDGRHAAFLLVRNHKQILVCDGKEGPEWDDLRQTRDLAPDGSPAYEARKGEKWYKVVVGRENKAVELPAAVVNQSPDRPPEGKPAATKIKTADGQCAVVRDGHEGPHFPSIKDLVFSPDGKRLAYVAGSRTEKDREVAVCDDKESPAYTGVRSLQFSPDSQSLAYSACTGDNNKPYPTNLVIWDGKEVQRMTWWPAITFSPDSQRLACSGGGNLVIYDRGGKEVRKFGLLFDNYSTAPQPVFSPDGLHVAYTISEGDFWRVYVDGQALPGAYVQGGKPNVVHVLPGQPVPPVPAPWRDSVPNPAFSADGRHIFFHGGRFVDGVNRRFMVIDGVARPEHDDLWIPSDFQNYPKTLRYVVRDADRLRLVETYWPEDMTWEKAAKGETN